VFDHHGARLVPVAYLATFEPGLAGRDLDKCAGLFAVIAIVVVLSWDLVKSGI
jgi:hypothetical protein